MYDEIAPSVETPYAVCFCVIDELVSKGSVLDAIPLCDCVAEPVDDNEPSADVAVPLRTRLAATVDDRPLSTDDTDEVIACAACADVNRPPSVETTMAVPLPISVAVMLLERAPSVLAAVPDCDRLAVTEVDSERALEPVAVLLCVAVAEVESAPSADEATADEVPLFVAVTLEDNAPSALDPDAV